MAQPIAFHYEECPNCETRIETKFKEKYFHTGRCNNCGAVTMVDTSTFKNGSYSFPCLTIHCPGCHKLVECRVEHFSIYDYEDH